MFTSPVPLETLVEPPIPVRLTKPVMRKESYYDNDLRQTQHRMVEIVPAGTLVFYEYTEGYRPKGTPLGAPKQPYGHVVLLEKYGSWNVGLDGIEATTNVPCCKFHGEPLTLWSVFPHYNEHREPCDATIQPYNPQTDNHDRVPKYAWAVSAADVRRSLLDSDFVDHTVIWWWQWADRYQHQYYGPEFQEAAA